MTTRVLVIGAGGQLGRAMASRWPHGEVTALTRADLDVTNGAAVRDAVRSAAPDIILNCAAYTDVDGAETAPEAALGVNAWGPHLVAEAADAHGATLVHFSTDFVFDGRIDRPYVEEDEPNPQSAYAASKLLGEWLAAEAARSYVLRVESLFGGPHAHSSIDRILGGLRAGTPVRAFVDRTVSPSYVDDVVEAAAALVAGRAPYGTYHCVNTGWTTWADLAREAARLLGAAGAEIVEIPMADARLKAERPQFAALSNAKLARVGIAMPSWQDALGRHIACT